MLHRIFYEKYKLQKNFSLFKFQIKNKQYNNKLYYYAKESCNHLKKKKTNFGRALNLNLHRYTN